MAVVGACGDEGLHLFGALQFTMGFYLHVLWGISIVISFNTEEKTDTEKLCYSIKESPTQGTNRSLGPESSAFFHLDPSWIQ